MTRVEAAIVVALGTTAAFGVGLLAYGYMSGQASMRELLAGGLAAGQARLLAQIPRRS